MSGSRTHMEATVSGPRRPMYIVRMMRRREATEREGVIPTVSPTVPMADTTSNRTAEREKTAQDGRSAP